MLRAFKMTIRFKPSRAEDARALEYLQGADCSYSKAVVNAINGYLDAQEKENREDSFLGRVRMMLREELKSIGNGTPFSRQLHFHNSHGRTMQRWRFWTLSTAWNEKTTVHSRKNGGAS